MTKESREIDALIADRLLAEYGAQIIGGIPMAQTETVRQPTSD